MHESELPPPRHEASDIGVRLIWIGVPAVLLGVLLMSWLVLTLYPGITVDRTLKLPLARYPAPELQTDPVGDMNRLREAQLTQLRNGGWDDAAHRSAHLPIAEAMREVASEGVADWPSAPRGTSVRASLLALLLTVALPALAMDVGFEPHPGSQLPLSAPMIDESDRPVRLGAAMHGSAWILMLGYFNCPNLCDTVRADLIGALKGLPPDLDYGVAAVSVDAHEAVADVNEARVHDAMYLSRASAWRYLRADAGTLATLTAAAGFRDRFDASTGQIAHPAGLVFVTPQGQVSSYLFGVGYRGEEVARALEDAARGRIAAAPPAALALLCFDFDSATGRYSFAIVKLLRAVSIVCVLALAGGLLVLFRRPRVPA